MTSLFSGWLTKKAKVLPMWKRRWFELTKDHFSYHPAQGEPAINTVPLGVIQKVHTIDGEKENCFVVLTPTREYILQADSAQLTGTWVAILQHTIGGENSSSNYASPSQSDQFSLTPLKDSLPQASTSSNNNNNAAPTTIFISLHVGSMLESARILKTRLIKEGWNVWLCADDLKGGEDFRDGIVAAVKDSAIFIPLLNDRWGASGECKDEFNFAKRRSLTTGRPIFVPVAFSDLEWSKYPHVELLAASVNFIVHPASNLVPSSGGGETDRTLDSIVVAVHSALKSSTTSNSTNKSQPYSGIHGAAPAAAAAVTTAPPPVAAAVPDNNNYSYVALSTASTTAAANIPVSVWLNDLQLANEASKLWTQNKLVESGPNFVAAVVGCCRKHFQETVVGERGIIEADEPFLVENIVRLAGNGGDLQKFVDFWRWFRDVEAIASELGDYWRFGSSGSRLVDGFTSRVEAERQCQPLATCLIRFGSQNATLAITTHDSSGISHKLINCKCDGLWLLYSAAAAPPRPGLRIVVEGKSGWLGPFSYMNFLDIFDIVSGCDRIANGVSIAAAKQLITKPVTFASESMYSLPSESNISHQASSSSTLSTESCYCTPLPPSYSSSSSFAASSSRSSSGPHDGYPLEGGGGEQGGAGAYAAM